MGRWEESPEGSLFGGTRRERAPLRVEITVVYTKGNVVVFSRTVVDMFDSTSAEWRTGGAAWRSERSRGFAREGGFCKPQRTVMRRDAVFACVTSARPQPARRDGMVLFSHARKCDASDEYPRSLCRDITPAG